jgi:hypothetical protein
MAKKVKGLWFGVVATPCSDGAWLVEWGDSVWEFHEGASGINLFVHNGPGGERSPVVRCETLEYAVHYIVGFVSGYQEGVLYGRLNPVTK